MKEEDGEKGGGRLKENEVAVLNRSSVVYIVGITSRCAPKKGRLRKCYTGPSLPKVQPEVENHLHLLVPSLLTCLLLLYASLL